jgi:hypothetical protein
LRGQENVGPSKQEWRAEFDGKNFVVTLANFGSLDEFVVWEGGRWTEVGFPK